MRLIQFLEAIREKSELEQLFDKTATAQRGAPERAMLDLQFALGGGVYSFVLEHVGDITHRMTNQFDYLRGDLENVYNKVNKTLRTLEHGYGFEREFAENKRDSYQYFSEEGRLPKGVQTEVEYDDLITRLGKKYSEAHEKVPVFNMPQWRARQAAIALGKQNFAGARNHLRWLHKLVQDEKKYKEAVSKVTFTEATAYHGSPHLFTKFDISKLGTGEGYQKFGYGLYFAENPETAEYYMQPAPGGTGLYIYTVEIPDSAIERMLDWDASIDQQPETIRALLTQRASAKMEKIMDVAIEDMAENGPFSASEDQLENLVDELVRYGGYGSNGMNVFDYLNELAPNVNWKDVAAESDDFDPEVDTGEHIYRTLEHELGSEKAASEYLLQYADVPGIRYLDAGSRGAGEGQTNNLVLFNDALINVADVRTAEGNPVYEGMDNAAFLSQDRPGAIAVYPLPQDSVEYQNLNTGMRRGPAFRIGEAKMGWSGGKPPWEMSKEEFTKHHITGYIDPKSYRELTTGMQDADYLQIESHPKVVARANISGLDIEFRKTGRPLQYVYPMSDTPGDFRRDEKGELLYMTPDEMEAEGIPTEDQSIVAYHNGKPVAFTSNEWGAVGLWVADAYQRKGIGTYLLKMFMEENPHMQLGQATPAGRSATEKVWQMFQQNKGQKATEAAGTSKYPKQMAADEIVQYVLNISRDPSDIEVQAGASKNALLGIVQNLVAPYEMFELVKIPTNELDAERYADTDLVDKYYNMFQKGQTDYPPIVVTSGNHIVDGAHRTAALEWSEAPYVWAYKPNRERGK